jgi:hypothetical protein
MLGLEGASSDTVEYIHNIEHIHFYRHFSRIVCNFLHPLVDHRLKYANDLQVYKVQ